MNSLLSPLLADVSDLPWIAMIAIGGGILIAMTAMIAGIWFAQRRQQMWHETARAALEKGQPLPALPHEAEAEGRPTRGPMQDLRLGLILVAAGGGLFLFMSGIGGSKLAMVGAIPGFIGIALLLFGLLSLLFRRHENAADNLPPKRD